MTPPGGRERVDADVAVGDEADLGVGGARGLEHALDLRRVNERIGDGHRRKARLDEHDRLVGLRGRQPDGAVIHLQPRDLEALVRLDVRAQGEAMTLGERLHAAEIGEQTAVVEREARRLDRTASLGLGRGHGIDARHRHSSLPSVRRAGASRPPGPPRLRAAERRRTPIPTRRNLFRD